MEHLTICKCKFMSDIMTFISHVNTQYFNNNGLLDNNIRFVYQSRYLNYKLLLFKREILVILLISHVLIIFEDLYDLMMGIMLNVKKLKLNTNY